MANTLMFEVGVSNSVKNLDNVKKLLDEFINHYSKVTEIKLKIEIDNLKAVTDALSHLGDNQQLRNLRTEIEAINKEFAKLSVGAGGTGDMGVRGMNQEVTDLKQKWESAIRTLGRYNEELAIARRNRDLTTNSTDRQGYTDQINKLKEQIRVQQDIVNASKQAYEASKSSANNVAQVTQQNTQSLSKESSAAQDAANKLNALVAEKQQVVNAEKKLAESSENASKNLNNEKTSATDTANALNNTKKAAEQNANAQADSDQKAMTTKERYLKLISDVENKIANIGRISATGESIAGLNPATIREAERRFEEFLNKFRGFENEIRTLSNGEKISVPVTSILGEQSTERLANLRAQFARLTSEYKDIISVADKYNKAVEKEAQAEEKAVNQKLAAEERAGAARVKAREKQEKDYEKVWLKGLQDREKAAEKSAQAEEKARLQAAKQQAAEYKNLQKNSQDARTEAERLLSNREKLLRTQSQSLSKILSGGKGKLDTYQYEQVRDALRSIRNELRGIETAKQRGGLSTGALLSLGGGTSDYSAIISAYKQFIRGKQEASSANRQLTSSEQQLASAINHSSQQMRSQSQVLGELKSYAKQYLSVWGTQSFVNKIIETGGLLEQQRMAIGAILGDMSHANTLFGQIKSLALKSPFGVVQLDTMSKQLTAYNFQYSELYDWTKRLADISAATGTEVSRLSLALGHVRSEGALSGYTLRQFAMGNVPLLQTLAKQLGKTTSEIRKMTRTKDISYEDVAEALKSLTENGGMFENAQEIMSGALNAKFKNLRDAFDIMYGEMAESGVGDTLKGVATTLTVLAKNWKMTGTAILSVVGALGAYKAIQILSNKAMVQSNLEAGRFTAKQIEMQVRTGNLTRAQLLQAVATKKVAVADVEAAGAELGLSRAQLQHVANTGKVSAAMNIASIATSKYTVSQLRAMAVTKNMGAGAKILAYLNRGWIGLTAGIKAATSAVQGFFISSGPMLALMGGMELWMYGKQKDSDRKERIGQIQEAANEGLKNLQEQASNFKIGSSIGLDSKQLRASIEDMMQVLKDYSPQANNTINEALKVDEKTGKSVMTLAEKYELLAKAIDDTKESYKEMGVVSDIIEEANDETGVRWDDPTKIANDFFRDNTEDYINALKERNRAERDYIEKNRTTIISSLEATRKEFDSYNETIKLGTSLYESSNGSEGFSQDDLKTQLEMLRSNTQYVAFFDQQMKKAGDDALDSWQKYNKEIRNTANARADMDKDMQTFTSSLKKRLEVQFGTTADKWTEAQKLAVQKSLEIWMTGIDGYSNMTDKERKEIEEKLLAPLEIKIDADARDANKEITALISSLNQLVGKDWVVRLGLDKSTDALDAVDKMKKKLKEARETISDYGDIKGLSKDKNGKYIIPSEYVIKPKSEKPSQIQSQWGKNVTVDVEPVVSEEDLKLQLAAAYNNAMDTVGTVANNFFGGLGLNVPSDKTSSGKRNKADTDYAKNIREKIRVMKEAADAYQYWREKVGDNAAFVHVEQEFGAILTSIGLEVKSARDLRSMLNSLTPEIKGIKDKKVQTESFKEQAKELAQLDRKDFEKTADEFASKVQIELDSLTRAWEIFNNVREATGNVELAIQISGASYDNEKNRNIAEALKEKIQKDLSNIKDGLTIEFDINMSDKDIQKEVEKKFESMKPVKGMDESADSYAKRLREYQTYIKGIVDETKKWRDLQLDIYKNDTNIFASIIGSASDYKTEIEKINKDYNDAKDSLDRLLDSWNKNERDANGNRKGITQEQYNKALGIKQFDKNYKTWQKETAYINLMNNALSMTRKEIVDAADVQRYYLNEGLKEGAISAHEYVEEMKKLDEILSNYETGSTTPFSSFLKGGMRGLANYYKGLSNYYLTKYSNSKDKTSPEALAYYDAYTRNQKKYEKYSKSAEDAETFVAVLEDLNKAAQFLCDTFEKLGKASGNSDLQNVTPVIGGMASGASSLSSFGSFGAFVGAGIGMFTGTFEAMDNSLNQGIESLKANIKALDNNTEILKSSKDRTLGYDNRELMKYYYSQYNDAINRGDYTYRYKLEGWHEMDGSDAWIEEINHGATAMRDLYKELSESTPYSKDLEDLKKKREDLLRMYHAEAEKKDSSDEALEEYKKEIAELDEQIRFFAEDLSKSLYDIDLKGWADEFGDALMTAFENGEDAAEAFNNTVQDIMRNVLRKMLSLGIIQPMMERLRIKLFGENGEGGSFDPNNPEGTIDAAMRDVTAFFGEGGEGRKMIEATEMFYNKWEDFMKSQGFTLEDVDSSKSTGSSIKSITESTADLLASYVNAIRADVSVDRNMIAQYYPMFYQALTSSNASLANIANHTAAIMRSNDAIEQSNQAILARIDGLRNKSWRLPFE